MCWRCWTSTCFISTCQYASKRSPPVDISLAIRGHDRMTSTEEVFVNLGSSEQKSWVHPHQSGLWPSKSMSVLKKVLPISTRTFPKLSLVPETLYRACVGQSCQTESSDQIGNNVWKCPKIMFQGGLGNIRTCFDILSWFSSSGLSNDLPITAETDCISTGLSQGW